ncbi:MAG: MBL fold metallo-hydrolase [Clostridiales bacterium]|jgi:glyoxylase-like metal-dependent hydrolase (beta-lactamase superfamily II)|nr:MBL fold metallo-hydrolase [Clostridiales bacterium]
MESITVVNAVLSENTYIVYDADTLRGFLIDPGSDGRKIEAAAARKGVKIEAALLTHGHFDHALSAAYFQAKGVKIYVSKADADKIEGHSFDMSRFFGREFVTLTADCVFDCDYLNGFDVKAAGGSLNVSDMKNTGKEREFMSVSDGGFLNVAGMKAGVIYTPGHSRGGVCFYFEKEGVLFSGDTLFSDGIGRSDFSDGDFLKLKESITAKLFSLPDETVVRPGHGEATAIGLEKRNKTLFS